MRRSTLFVGPLLLLSSSQEAATVATELQRLATGLWGFRRSQSDSHGMPWLNHGDSWGTHWTHHGKGHPWTIPAGFEGNFRGTIFFAKSQVRSTVFCDFPRKLLSDTIQGLEKISYFCCSESQHQASLENLQDLNTTTKHHTTMCFEIFWYVLCMMWAPIIRDSESGTLVWLVEPSFCTNTCLPSCWERALREVCVDASLRKSNRFFPVHDHS